VIVGTHAVMADGGLMAHSGVNIVAQVNIKSLYIKDDC
jgi:translation initiation factor 2B subunit (eIF-2B alpha/beta/delta family)